MDCEEPMVDDAGEREEVETVHEHVVNLLIVLVDALCPEIEEVGHLPALVVASDEGHRVGESYF